MPLPLFAETEACSIPVIRDPEPQGNFDHITIPLRRVQNLFIIEARVDSMQGNFIFDTGALHLVLNKTYFRNGKKSDASNYGITGGGEQVMTSRVDTLSLGTLFYTDIIADVVNLGHIEDARGIKILGLLGADLFSGLVMEIDVAASVLRLYKPCCFESNFQKNDSLYSGVAEWPVEAVNDIIFVQASAAGKDLRFCLDSGAETNVLSNAVSNKILKTFSLTTRTSLGGSGSQDISVLNGKLASILVGDKEFRDMPFVLTNLFYLQEVYATVFDGVLGYYFLSKGKVIIDPVQKKLIMYFYKDN